MEQIDSFEKMKRKKLNTLCFYILSSGIIWIVTVVLLYFSTPLIQSLWVFALIPFIVLGLSIFINVVLIFLHLINCIKKNNSLIGTIVLLFLNLIIPFLLIISPLPEYHRRTSFQRLKQSRIDVIENYEEDGYVITGDQILLPESEWELSSTGWIFFVEANNSKYYLFYYTNGIPDGYTGFLYSVDDSRPSIEDLSEHVYEIKKIENNWYWVEAD